PGRGSVGPMSLDKLIRHAERYGVEGVYDIGVDELPAEQLPGLAARLKSIAGHRRERLGLPTSRNGQEHADPGKNGQCPQALSRNANGIGGISPSVEAVTDNRRCEGCGAPLPSTLRSDARYCIGGACKQAAYRARGRVA